MVHSCNELERRVRREVICVVSAVGDIFAMLYFDVYLMSTILIWM